MKFIVSYAVLIGVVFFLGGWLLFYHVEKVLDEELSKRILGVSEIVSATLQTPYLKKIQPGDEESYLYRVLITSLKKIQEKSHVKDIFIFNRENRILLDADEEVPIGEAYLFLKLDLTELEEVWKGKPSTSVLYRGTDKKFYKSGYSPIYDEEGRIFAVAGVEAGADFLEILNQFKKNIFFSAFLVFIFIVFVSWLISRSIINPVKRLVSAMDRLGQKQSYSKVPVTTHDEIGFLSRRFNEMIDNISEKDSLLMERLATLKQMSATVAHEIRNPLGAIEGYAELLERKIQDEKSRLLAGNIIEEVKILNRIVTEFLAFAREPKLNRKPVPLEPILQKTLDMACAAHKTIPIQARLHVPSSLPPVDLDENEFKKALLNILLNAIQSMPQGGNLDIHARARNHLCSILISDTGHGIPPSEQSKIFNPFFTTKETGTGLGLAIAHKIIVGHSGTVSFTSEANKGTEFTITLPFSSGDKK